MIYHIDSITNKVDVYSSSESPLELEPSSASRSHVMSGAAAAAAHSGGALAAHAKRCSSSKTSPS
jgi:hypothetical protein